MHTRRACRAPLPAQWERGWGEGSCDPSRIELLQDPFANHQLANLLVRVCHRLLTGDLTGDCLGDIAAVDRLSRVVMLRPRARYRIAPGSEQSWQEWQLLDGLRVFQNADSGRRNVLVEQQALLLFRRGEPENEVERGVSVLAPFRNTEQPVAGHIGRLDALLRRL